MSRNRYFLFDTETGGLDASSVTLFSFFGLILNDQLQIEADINLNIKPNDGIYHVDAEALKVNGINIVTHHASAISEKEASKKFLDFVSNKHSIHNENKLIPAGHCIGRLDIPMGERLIGFQNWNRLFNKRTIDTATIAQYLVMAGKLPTGIDCSLPSLCNHFGIQYAGAHNAKNDVFMTLEVLRKMKDINAM